MTTLPAFAANLLEEAKRFLEKANETPDPAGERACLHAALVLGFAAFEAHVNAMCDDFLSRQDLNPHERGLLAEQTVELSDGEFRVKKNSMKIWRLEERVLFLCRRFSKRPIDRRSSYWSQFTEAVKLRNGLTHPKADPPSISQAVVTQALRAIIELLQFMFANIYKRKLPAYSRGLSSKLTF